jgi:hypothetical protein
VVASVHVGRFGSARTALAIRTTGAAGRCLSRDLAGLRASEVTFSSFLVRQASRCRQTSRCFSASVRWSATGSSAPGSRLRQLRRSRALGGGMGGPHAAVGHGCGPS